MRTDVLLVVATDTERDALFAAAGMLDVPPLHHGEGRSYHDLGIIGGARVLAVQTEMGTAGVGGSLTTILTAIGEVRPTTILMVGIAFGVDPEKQPIGRILVSKQIQQYGPAREGTDADGRALIVPRGDRASATPMVINRLHATSVSFKEAEVEFGLLLSGESLVDNLEYRAELQRREPEAAGGEMEGGGLYAAAAEKRLAWCVVKGVCDYADGKKREQKKERQTIAARNAARFVVAAIANGSFAPRAAGAPDPG